MVLYCLTSGNEFNSCRAACFTTGIPSPTTVLKGTGLYPDKDSHPRRSPLLFFWPLVWTEFSFLTLNWFPMLIFVVITLCKYSDFIKLITEQPLHFVYNSRFIHFIMLKVYPHIFPFSNNLIPFQRSVALSSILFRLLPERSSRLYPKIAQWLSSCR